MRMPPSAISASAPLRSSARIVPPCPSGESATRPRSASRILPLTAVDRRHLALDEEAQALDAERVVALEERRRLGVVLGARHHVQRHRRPVPAAERHHLLGVDLEERPVADRADRVAALGAVEPEPRPLAAGDDHDRHLSRRKHSAPGEDVLGAGPHHLGRLHRAEVDRSLALLEQASPPARRRGRGRSASTSAASRGLRVGVQLLPEAQQVLLAVARQRRPQLLTPAALS